MFEVNFRPKILEAKELAWHLRMATSPPVAGAALKAYQALADLENYYREAWERAGLGPCPWKENA